MLIPINKSSRQTLWERDQITVALFNMKARFTFYHMVSGVTVFVWWHLFCMLRNFFFNLYVVYFPIFRKVTRLNNVQDYVLLF